MSHHARHHRVTGRSSKTNLDFGNGIEALENRRMLTAAAEWGQEVAYKDTTHALAAITVAGNTPGAIVGNVRMLNEATYSASDYRFQVSDHRFEVDDNAVLRLKRGVSLDPNLTIRVNLTLTVSAWNGGSTSNPQTTDATIYIMPGQGQVDFRNGVLRVMGTNGDDNYNFFKVGSELRFSNGTEVHSFTPVAHVVVDGLAGNDRLIAGSSVLAACSMFGRSGDDTIIGSAYHDDLRGGTGNDLIIGLDGYDTLFGDLGADSLQANEGRDVLVGGHGKDRLVGGSGADTILGGHGDDVLFGITGNDTMRGGAGVDHVYGGDGADTMFGGDGNDVLAGHQGGDQISANAGHDRVFGGEGHDDIFGGEGNDELLGFFGFDRIYGEAGDDQIAGGNGSDTIFGGVGMDRIFGGDSNDTIHGNEGDDEIFGGDGDDMVYGGPGANKLYGNQGSDHVIGNDGHDYLNGGADPDIVVGGGGNDKLYGMQDDDILIGGSGLDQLTGGDGEDILIEGSTAHDDNVEMRSSMLNTWTSRRGPRVTAGQTTARQERMRSEFGMAYGNNVIADLSRDVLIGNAGTDWFFASMADAASDVSNGEVVERF